MRGRDGSLSNAVSIGQSAPRFLQASVLVVGVASVRSGLGAQQSFLPMLQSVHSNAVYLTEGKLSAQKEQAFLFLFFVFCFCGGEGGSPTEPDSSTSISTGAAASAGTVLCST